jgi:type I restriction enzyme S subunit
VTDVNQLITDHLDTWTAVTAKKSSAGRGTSGAVSLYGIKKLRELILELAVRGKLVPQEGSVDEGGNLLSCIKRLQQQLYQKKSIKKPKILPEPSHSDLNYEVPKGWAVARLNDLGDWGAGTTPSRKSSGLYGGDIPWFKSGELTADLINVSEETVTQEALKKSSLRLNRPGDVLVAMYGATIGKTAILEVEATTNQAVCACTPFDGFLNQYLLLLLKAYRGRLVGMGAGGAQPNISREKIIATVVALPPTAEQHRIVAKVDELMGLCDRLEAQAEDSLKAHQTLVETCLATLTNSQNPEDLTQNWTRIEVNFDTLFTTQESVSHLKEVVLQLGVRGKLLPQNLDDEAADVLLQGLLKASSKKSKRGRGAVGESTMITSPFPLPENWIWHQFGDLVEFQSELVQPNGYMDCFQVAPDIIEKGTGKLTDQRTVEESGIRGPNNLFYKGQVLYSKIRPSLSKAVIAPYDGLCSADMYPLKSLIDPDYLLLSILSEDFLAQVRKLENRIKMPKLNVGSLSSIHIALPPLAEQSRIVAKVKSMFQLCDQMRAKIEASQQCSIKLANTLTSQIH